MTGRLALLGMANLSGGAVRHMVVEGGQPFHAVGPAKTVRFDSISVPGYVSDDEASRV